MGFFSYFSFFKQSYFPGRAKKPLERHKCKDRDFILNYLYSHCYVISKVLSMAPCLSLNCDVILGNLSFHLGKILYVTVINTGF